MAEIIEEVPAIAISFDHQISEGRILRFQTGIAQDAPQAAVNALVDKLMAVTDRQAARYELEGVEASLAQDEKLYVMRQEDMVRLDAEARAAYEAQGRRTPWTPDKLPPNKLSERANADIFVKRIRDEITKKRERAAALSKVVNGANSAANSH